MREVENFIARRFATGSREEIEEDRGREGEGDRPDEEEGKGGGRAGG